MSEQIGAEFQELTKYHRGRMPQGGPDWAARPDVYKEYPESSLIELPPVVAPREAQLDEVLRERGSVRDFSSGLVSAGQLSYLLWASAGIRTRESGHEFRTAPSAGALYPIETYIVTNNVADIESGLYHYSVRKHSLELLKQGALGANIAAAAMDQEMCADAAVVFAWTAIFARSSWKYKQRAYRYVYLDAGHIAQNLALASVALGLGSCQVGALYDEEVDAILGVDGKEESIIYMSAVGHPV